MTPTTPHKLVYIVVCTAAIAFFIFICTLAYMLITGAHPDDKTLTYFVAAGTAAFGFLSGVLTNTRTQSTPIAESTQVITTTSTDPTPVPPLATP